jgi:hypothetical protein
MKMGFHVVFDEFYECTLLGGVSLRFYMVYISLYPFLSYDKKGEKFWL